MYRAPRKTFYFHHHVLFARACLASAYIYLIACAFPSCRDVYGVKEEQLTTLALNDRTHAVRREKTRINTTQTWYGRFRTRCAEARLALAPLPRSWDNWLHACTSCYGSVPQKMWEYPISVLKIFRECNEHSYARLQSEEEKNASSVHKTAVHLPFTCERHLC